nr:unnamed protein product [Spirometra erinaceieuropaei]
MKANILLFSFAAIISLFYTGRGEEICSWSQRIIPRNATGDITLEVPIMNKYKGGYIGNETLWAFARDNGWCSYSGGGFVCTNTTHDGYDATSLTLSNVEEISYVMLESDYPITIHKSGDKSFLGFHAKEGTGLDICTNRKYAQIKWFFNGNESDLQDMSCYEDHKLVCSGLRPVGARKDKKCGHTKEDGRIEFRYTFFKKGVSKNFFYCYTNKEKTRALTYIIDWRVSTDSAHNPVIPKEKMYETDNSGAGSLIDAAGLILFNLGMFLM